MTTAAIATMSLTLAAEGTSGSIFCEDFDCSWEHGGFVTFDREVERLDRGFLRKCHEEIYVAAEGGGKGEREMRGDCLRQRH